MGGIFAGWNFRWVEFSLGGIFVGGIFVGGIFVGGIFVGGIFLEPSGSLITASVSGRVMPPLNLILPCVAIWHRLPKNSILF